MPKIKSGVSRYIRAVKINTELEKMIQPMSELDSKSKKELLEIILKTKALLAGTISKAEQEIPTMYLEVLPCQKQQ